MNELNLKNPFLNRPKGFLLQSEPKVARAAAAFVYLVESSRETDVSSVEPL